MFTYEDMEFIKELNINESDLENAEALRAKLKQELQGYDMSDSLTKMVIGDLFNHLDEEAPKQFAEYLQSGLNILE